jgi:FtsP/CotA-like multicopper oxidase with cupredoxin domain
MTPVSFSGRRDRFLLALLVIGAYWWGSATAIAEPRVLDLTVTDRRLPEPQRVIRAHQGEEITLRWTTDRPLTVHLHGYDVEKKLAPGAPTVMTLTLRAAGRFAITIHGGHTGGEATLGYLEVRPR